MWAWIFSVAAHLVLLAVFARVRFSLVPDAPSPATIPVVAVEQIEQIIKQAAILPKPKVKRFLSNRTVKRENEINFPAEVRTDEFYKQKSLPEALATGGIEMLSSVHFSHDRTEFFGQSTSLRRICYVVDCSGSMQGMFSRVRKQLKNSIAKLLPDHYFCIIFFGGERLLESGRGKLRRATPDEKSAASAFIDTVGPTGGTNVLAAVERAMRLSDPAGKGPQLIYLLTDGLDLDRLDNADFALHVEYLRKKLAPETKINTIGFWAQPDDCRVLQAVARISNGQFTNID
ncbi:MAG TPA: VWA domain-containing protein [Planctomycetes bacterium]|nr:VWA domain-containing protein [Planctomycetota bacterium]